MRSTLYRVGIIGYVWPETTSSAAGLRDQNLVDFFLAHHFEVHYLCAAKQNFFSDYLRKIHVHVHSIELNHSSFDSLIQQLDLDFIIFDRYVTEEQYGSRVEKNSPRTVRILDTQDLHSLRLTREKLLQAGASPEAILQCKRNLDPQWLLRELAAIYRSDLTLILSDQEFALLQEGYQVPPSLLLLFPFCYPIAPARSAWHARQHFCFIGNYQHLPNLDAVAWLCEEIWPMITQAIPNAELHLYGAYPPKSIMNRSNSQWRIQARGPVEDHITMLEQHRVNLAPLRFGAGIKGKITDAWYAGTPTIATAIGAEGLQSGEKWGGSIANSAADFAQAAISLYNDPAQWTIAQTQGHNLLGKLFSQEILHPLLLKKFIYLRENLTTVREQNIIGAMLRHHLHRSTDYFSRWLEVKKYGGIIKP